MCIRDRDSGGGHWLVWMEWLPARWSVCLLLLVSPSTIKSRSSLLAPAHPGGPGKKGRKTVVCVCVLYIGSDISIQICAVWCECVVNIRVYTILDVTWQMLIDHMSRFWPMTDDINIAGLSVPNAKNHRWTKCFLCLYVYDVILSETSGSNFHFFRSELLQRMNWFKLKVSSWGWHSTDLTSSLSPAMCFLWPPYVIGGPSYFCPVVSFYLLSIYLSFFFFLA